MKMDQLIAIGSVEQMTGLRKSTLYSLIHKKLFPAGVVVASRSRRWPVSQVQSWISDQIKAA
jgi:predicted DNA-binding transcriptional regulator AlpA